MTAHKLEINLDAKCSACGKGGAIKDQRDGLCMDCISKRMKDRITRDILQEIAGDLEKLLIEKQQQINFAFKRVADGFKISIGVTLDNTIPPTATYSVSFPLEPSPEPPEKDKITLTKQIGQTEMDL